eukprot:2028799-Pleurochrysis_carterae.AAC.1
MQRLRGARTMSGAAGPRARCRRPSAAVLGRCHAAADQKRRRAAAAGRQADTAMASADLPRAPGGIDGIRPRSTA